MNRNTYDRPLFAASSPWNTAIPSLVMDDALSPSMINNLGIAMASKPLTVNTDAVGYGVPIFYADANTPLARVRDTTGWWDESRFTSVPMPPQAVPDRGSDRHLVVWDVPNDVLYEYWRMEKNSDGSWSAGYAIRFSATGAGYQTGIWQGSARAYGGSLAAGAIRYCEMVNGVIPHAIAMAYPFTRGDYYARGSAGGITSIASHCDNVRDSDRINFYNIPEGARLRLKPSVDLAARASQKSGPSQRACQIIGQALKTYGAYIVDTAGAPTLYAEILRGKDVSWNGLLSPLDSSPFLASDFEVLTLPNLTSANLR
jgi:hypothetical protein